MSMFESTFALLASAKVGFGPRDMGITFAILGVFAVIVQGGLIGPLAKKFGDAILVKQALSQNKALKDRAHLSDFLRPLLVWVELLGQ